MLVQVLYGLSTQGPVVSITNICGAGAVVDPVPTICSTCGDPGALSVTFICAVKIPAIVGVKFRVITQVASGASVSPFVPVSVTALVAARIKLPVPVLVTVIVCVGEVVAGL